MDLQPINFKKFKANQGLGQASGWSKPFSGFINDENGKTNLGMKNKYDNSKKVFGVIPNKAVSYSFKFDSGTMKAPFFFLQEFVNGSWKTIESTVTNLRWRSTIVSTVTPQSDRIRAYFEKGEASDAGQLTTASFSDFKLLQRGTETEVTPTQPTPTPTQPAPTPTQPAPTPTQPAPTPTQPTQPAPAPAPTQPMQPTQPAQVNPDKPFKIGSLRLSKVQLYGGIAGLTVASLLAYRLVKTNKS